MNAVRCFAAWALVLIGGLPLAWAQDKVLVRGDPPLTQGTVDLYQKIWEWYCDLRLAPEQRRQYQQHFVAFWTKENQANKQRTLTGLRAMEKEWRAILDLKEDEKDRKRGRVRERLMTGMRKSTDEGDRLLVRIYDHAYKPGGTKNPVLVKGDPRFTQSMVDLETAAAELILDLRLTGGQRRQFRDILIKAWNKADQQEKRKWAKSIETWAGLPTWSEYRRSLQRALKTGARRSWARGKTAGERWLAALEQATTKPGSARNPVLVDARPPLTQLVADRYADYVDVMLDLSVSGGLTAAQRKVLQDYLAKDWKKMSPDARKELLGDLKRWSKAAGQGAAEANKCLHALRPRLLAELRTNSDHQRSQYLVEIAAQERQLVQRRMKVQQQRAEMQRIADEVRQYIGSPGHWEYNGITRRLQWVPTR